VSAAAVLAILVASGCEAKPPAEAARRSVVRPVLGFAIDVPQGWTYRELGGDIVLEIYKAEALPATPTPSAGAEVATQSAAAQAAPATPGSGSGAVIHVVVIDRDRIGLKEWADQAIKDSQEIQSDLAVTSREETKLRDWRAENGGQLDAIRLTLRSGRAVEPLVQEMLLVQTASRAYAVIATGAASDMAAAQAAVKACFDSLVVW